MGQLSAHQLHSSPPISGARRCYPGSADRGQRRGGMRVDGREMESVHWPILSISAVTAKEFVEFWERLYSPNNPNDEATYERNIGQPLTDERIEKWFEWKNGTRLSERKK